MLWAQWTYFILAIVGFFLHVINTMTNVQREVVSAKKSVAEGATSLTIYILILFVVVLAGAFDKIIGWPN